MSNGNPLFTPHFDSASGGSHHRGGGFSASLTMTEYAKIYARVDAAVAARSHKQRGTADTMRDTLFRQFVAEAIEAKLEARRAAGYAVGRWRSVDWQKVREGRRGVDAHTEAQGQANARQAGRLTNAPDHTPFRRH